MTSSHHGPYDQGYTRATMAHTKRSDLARASGPHKVRRSPDWSLQLDSMKSESLVIVLPLPAHAASECKWDVTMSKQGAIHAGQQKAVL